MKSSYYIIGLLLIAGFVSCKKTIDLYPQSNLNTGTYYSNLEELKAGLTGVYNGMQQPLFYEWQFTELRSDNAKQGAPGSTASTNRDLSDLDMFTPATTHQANYNYWLATYNNIRNANLIIDRLGVDFDPAAGTNSFSATGLPVTEADIKQMAGEALFIRAYHYFNLVRLYGGVFLVHEPITPEAAKTYNRSSVQEVYKLIIADLVTAASSMNTLKFAQIPDADKGRATSWAAKSLLAKVYLTLNRKADAIPLLQDIKDNSGYFLQPSYNAIFSTGNEMNSEILFAVRFKAGGLGLGSAFANLFSPIGSGANVVNGDGDGLNYPTSDLDTASLGDDRRELLIDSFGTGITAKYYNKKYLSTLVLAEDAENDWPVIRYADVLLMLAEAMGNSPASTDLINSTRPRAGLPLYPAGSFSSTAEFEQALSHERRIEFAFENQRWFDLLRFNTTLTTITVEQTMKDHFADEYATHYADYTPPAPTLQELWDNVTPERMLLPIPQREIDTNTQLVIPQNPGY